MYVLIPGRHYAVLESNGGSSGSSVSASVTSTTGASWQVMVRFAPLKLSRWLSARSGTRAFTVHSHGSGILGCLGHNSFDDIDEFREVQVLASNKVVQVGAGWAHSAAITADGRLFTWGRTHDMRSALSLIKMLHAGGMSAWLARAITSAGGRSGVESLEPTEVDLGIDGEGGEAADVVEGKYRNPARAIAVACGGALTAVVTEAGEVRCMGMNHYGQCGVGHDDARVWHPEPVLGLGKELATSVAVGFQHGLLLTSSGRVFSWGKGERGQLGRGVGARRQTTAHAVPLQVADGAHKQGDAAPKAIKIGAGFGTSTALMSDGTVLVWGKMLSLQEEEDEDIATSDVGNDDPENIFSAGSKLRRFRDQMTPRIVEFDGKVTDFACSQFHTCYRTDDGRLWLTGVRRHVGIGGVGDAESMLQHTPLEVPLTGTALEVCDFTLACGFDTSLAITNDGDVYEWDWDLEVRPYTPTVPAKLDDICVGWKHALAVFK